MSRSSVFADMASQGVTSAEFNLLDGVQLLATDAIIGEDAQTKIDFETANEIHFDTNNSEAMVIDTNGKVGIGTSAPSASAAKLQIELANTTSVYNVAQNGLVLRNVSNNDDNQINMAFMSSHATTISAYIGMHSTNTGASTGNLLFATNPDGTAPADRMIITSAGKVGIGTTAPDNLLHLKKTSGSVYQKIESDDDSVGLIFDGVKASGYPTGVAIIQFKNDGDDVAKISADATADDAANLAFHTQAASGSLTQRMVIEGSGALTLTTAKLSVSLSGSDTLILGT